MSRGTTTAVPVTRPILDTMPAIYHDGHFLRGFVGGLDDVWSSVFATLDCLHAYVDPALTPVDFLSWLGGWVGTELDEDWSDHRRRAFIARAAGIYAGRGTAVALVGEIGLYAGGRVEVDDPGSVTTSRVPGGDGDREAERRARVVRVVVDVVEASSVNWPAMQAAVRAAVPAHLPVEIELRETGPGEGGVHGGDGVDGGGHGADGGEGGRDR